MNPTVLLLGISTLALGSASTSLAAEPTQPPVTVVESAPPATPPPGAVMFSSGDRERMLQDPEYRALKLEQIKMMYRRQYSDLGVALSLSDDMVEKLIGVLAESQLQTTVEGPFTRPGADPTEIVRSMEDKRVQKEAALKTLLGDAKYQEWQEYKRSLGARQQARNLRSILESSADPIREDQYQLIVTAMVEEQRRMSSEPRSEAKPPARPTSQADRFSMWEQSLERMAQYQARMRDAAAPYLSAPQLERYDQMRKQQLELQRMQMRMTRSRAEMAGELPAEGTQQTVTSGGTTYTWSESTSPDGTIGSVSGSMVSGTPPPPPPQEQR